MRKPTVSTSDVGRIFTKLKEWSKGPRRVNDNLYHFTPIVLPFPTSKSARYLNQHILVHSINHHKRKLGLRNPQLWSFLPNVVGIVGNLGEKIFIYYCVDEWSQFSFMDGRSMRDMERRILNKADLVITSARHLYNDKIRYNVNTHHVSHGVDYAYFSRTISEKLPLPKDMGDIKRPIIGFFGLIHEWIDLDLIAKIASARPDWSIVLIGRISVNVDQLKALGNVFFLGQKPYDKLINYCKGFDIGLIPFRINELTVNVNPIKLREYMAAGIPVVSTPLPEVIPYEDLVCIGHSEEEVISGIEDLLKDNNDELRLQRSLRMANETWEQKVDDISRMIASLNHSGIKAGAGKC